MVMISAVRNLTFLLFCALASGSQECNMSDMEAAQSLFYGRPIFRMNTFIGDVILTLFLSLVAIAVVVYLEHCSEFNK
jgi:hypothetical protein